MENEVAIEQSIMAESGERMNQGGDGGHGKGHTWSTDCVAGGGEGVAWSGDDVVGSGEGVGGGGDCVSVDGTHAEECGEVVYEDVGVNITGASMTNGGEDLHEGSDGVDDCDV